MMNLIAASRFFKRSVFGVMRFTGSSISLQPLKINADRCLCSKINSKHSQDTVAFSKKAPWKPIYFFPLIHIARLVNRFKLYQSVFTFITVPFSIGMYYYDMTDISTLLVVSGAATFTCFSLYVITSFFRKLIGVIFIDESKNNLRIGHLTFWGNRNDITVPIKDIIPLTDSDCNAKDAFIKLCRYSTEDVLYMTLRFGKILEKDDFQNVFGSFELLGLKFKNK